MCWRPWSATGINAEQPAADASLFNAVRLSFVDDPDARINATISPMIAAAPMPT